MQIKLSLLGGVRFFNSKERWQDVSMRDSKAIFEQDMVAADLALANSSSIRVSTVRWPVLIDNSLALRASWIQVARARLALRRKALDKGASAPELPTGLWLTQRRSQRLQLLNVSGLS